MASADDKAQNSKLSALAAYRQQRPSFARMVSWEFGRVGAQPARKSKYKGRYKDKEADEVDASEAATCTLEPNSEFSFTDNDNANSTDLADRKVAPKELFDESDDGSDEDSIYFSAEEDIEFLGLNEEEGKLAEPSAGDQEIKAQVKTPKSGNIPQACPERRRRASKKQRKRFRLQFLDHSMPFKNADSLGMDMPYSSVQENETAILKEVLSLVELCMRCNKLKRIIVTKKRSSSSEYAYNADVEHSEIPPGLYRMTSEQRHRQTFASVQLSWLHRVLSVFEHLFKETGDKFLVKIEDNVTVKPHLYLSRFFHDIWHLEGKQDPPTALTSSMCLPYTRATVMGSINPILFISHVAQCIDLMLPTFSKLHHGKPNYKEDEIADRNLTTAISRVSMALQSRYPKVVEYLFGEALPYCMWARGRVKKAAELFLAQSEIPKRVVYRTASLNEAGRMYAQFGDEEMARKMFIRAADLFCQNVSKVSFQEVINGQALMLVAAIEDVGVFSPDKARRAASAWQAVLQLYSPLPCVAEAIVASLLCFHAGHFTEGCWHEEAKSRLQVLAQKSPHIYLYLSMVHALSGEQEMSEYTYKTFINKNVLYDYDNVPGHGIWSKRRDRRYEYTPWQPLVNAMRKNSPIQLISVLWRTQLCHPVYTEDSDTSCRGQYVTDHCTEDLHLHLTKDGYLTGNMQMVLPPLKSVYLDPFTGSLVFPSIPLHTEPWYAGPCCDVTLQDSVNLPTAQKLFEDQDGNVVESLFTSKLEMDFYDYKNGTQTAMLFWCGIDGLRLKLDLRKALRAYIRQEIEVKIFAETKAQGLSKMSRAEWQKEMLELLNHHFMHGLDMDYGTIEQQINTSNRGRKPPQTGIPKQDKKAKKKGPKTKKTRKPFTVWLKHHRQVSKTLILEFSVTTPDRNDVLVLIDCSPKGFLKPVIFYHDRYNYKTGNTYTWHRIPADFSPLHTHKAEILSVCVAQKEKNNVTLFLCDATLCSFLYSFRTSPQYTDGGTNMELALRTNICMGNNLYGIHPDKTRLICSHISPVGSHSILSPIHYPFIQKLEIVGDRFLVTTEEGICLISPDTLNPVDIRISSKIASCPLMVDDSGRYAFIGLQSEDRKVKLLAEKTSGNLIKVALAVNTYLVIMELRTPERVDITSVTELPGTPVEGYMVSETAGLLVTATLHKSTVKCYTENLYQLSFQGEILGVLPCLGMGPHSFYSYYHPGGAGRKDPGRGLEECDPLPGWYVYFRDGYGGICCIRLGPSSR